MATKKVLLIGLDGAPPDMVFRCAREGLLPNIGWLMAKGAYGHLRSTIPPMTCPAWVSSVTGVDVEEHGVYDFFLHLDLERKKMIFANSRTRRVKALWNFLTGAGMSTICLDMPVTSPPEKIEGAMISGFLSPSTRSNFTYPRGLKEELLEMGYRIDVGDTALDRIMLFKQSPLRFIGEFTSLIRRRLRAAEYLMENFEWDLFITIFTALDRINHFLWEFLDPAHVGYRKEPDILVRIAKAYREADRAVGELVRKAGPDTDIIIYSDHGFRPLNYVFFMNSLFMAKGILKVRRRAISSLIPAREAYVKLSRRIPLLEYLRRSLLPTWLVRDIGQAIKPSSDMFSFSDIDPESTVAFQLGQNIHINLRALDGEEVQEVLKRVQEVLEEARKITKIGGVAREMPSPVEAGKKIPVISLYPEGDISAKHYMPISGRMIYKYGSTRQEDIAIPALMWSGDHSLNGILVMAGPDIKVRGQMEGARIMDIAPTVLKLLGLEIPSHMKGRPLI